MKNVFIFSAILCGYFFITGMAPVDKYTPEVNAAYEQLKSELQQKGVGVQEVTDSAAPIKDLIAQGVKKDELKRYVMDLCNKKLDEASVKTSLSSVSALMKDGEAFRKAKDFVSGSLQQAQAQGLQGDGLKKKLQDAVHQKTAALADMKKQACAKGQQMKEEACKTVNGLQNRSLKDWWSAWGQKKAGDEPTKSGSQEGLAKLTQQAQQKTVNSGFAAVRDNGGKAPEVKDLDEVLRPVLQKLYGDARIVAESRSPETKVDGEVVENRITYAVSRTLAPNDGVALHAALRSAGFSTSPRLGAKPTIWSGGATMSLFKSTALRSYSLVVNIDSRKQQVTVESYKLGSKYDRLM
jgi:hypothetical protein